jgi:hypothetical protein
MEPRAGLDTEATEKINTAYIARDGAIHKTCAPLMVSL